MGLTGKFGLTKNEFVNMENTKINSTLLKNINRKIVLKVIHDAGTLSRVEIKNILKKDGKTVTNITNSLLKDGLLVTNGYSSYTGGRRRELLTINSNYGYIIGIHLGVNHLRGVVTDFNHNILVREKIPISPSESKIKIISRINKILKHLINRADIPNSKILGIGFIANGFYDNESGEWLLSVNNLNWKNVPIRKILTKQCDVPVYLEDVTNLMAIIENNFGEAKNKRDYIFLDIGMGVGCGIIYDNHLLRGSTNIAGEFGHTIVVPNGELCSCGNRGCLETVASGWAIIKEIKKKILSGAKSQIIDLCEGDLENIEIDMVFQSFIEGDTLAIEVLDSASEYLSIGIANLINLFNPELIVFGGHIATLGDYYMKIIKNKIQKYAIPKAFTSTKIIISSHDEDDAVLGATALVRDPFFKIDEIR